MTEPRDLIFLYRKEPEPDGHVRGVIAFVPRLDGILTDLVKEADCVGVEMPEFVGWLEENQWEMELEDQNRLVRLYRLVLDDAMEVATKIRWF